MSRFSLLFSYFGHFLIWKLLSNSRMVMDLSCLHYKCIIYYSKRWWNCEDLRLYCWIILIMFQPREQLWKRIGHNLQKSRSVLASWLQEENNAVINSLHKMLWNQFCQLPNPDLVCEEFIPEFSYGHWNPWIRKFLTQSNMIFVYCTCRDHL